jgi:tetratricopeptide (TPR) repeat protein
VRFSHRSALSAGGLAVALAVSAIPSVLGAQMRPQGPGPDTKRAVVTTFRGEPDAGVRLANEIRNRIQTDFNIRQLMPVSKKDIDNTLVASGYKPDSALSPNDIKELAKLVRGDEVIDGDVRKTAAGYRVYARLFLPRDVALSQPLITVESSNLGDVAKQIVREYEQARKQIPSVQECEAALRGQKVDDAVAAARKGTGAYQRATISRLCLANAYQTWKNGPDSATKPWKDSVLAVTTAVTKLDPASTMALRLQYDVYKAQGDQAKQMQTLVQLMGADPTNVALREQVIAELVTSGKANDAVPIIDSLVKANPGDPQYMRTRWLVLRAAQRWKDAIAAGQAYVAADPTAADSGYYERMISDYASDSAFGKAAEMAAQAIAKYPRNARLYLVKAQNERRAGQLDAAIASLRKGLELDPKAPGANLLLAQMNVDTGKLDEAVAAVKADVAADPTNKERNAQFLLGLASTSYRSAAASKKPEDFQKAMKLAQASDEINASPQAKFIAAVSGWQQLAPSLQQGKNWKCADVRAAEANLTVVSANMPGGGSVDAATAGQIMGAVPQAQQYIDAQTKRLCK